MPNFTTVLITTKDTLGLRKENLKSDGQQFCQYQPSEQSPLILTHWTQKKTTRYDVGNPVPDLGNAQTECMCECTISCTNTTCTFIEVFYMLLCKFDNYIIFVFKPGTIVLPSFRNNMLKVF